MPDRSRAWPTRCLTVAPIAAAVLATLAGALPAHSSPRSAWRSGAGGGATGPTGPLGAGDRSQRSLCKRYRPRLLCPDLIMSAPTRLRFDRTTIRGHVLLRAASSVDSL